MSASSWLGPIGALGVAVMIGGTRYLLMTGVMAVAMLGAGLTAGARRSRSARLRRREARERHEKHLADIQSSLIESGSTQRRRETRAEPEPDLLEQIVSQRVRIWERLPHHPDFTTVRVGIGPVTPDLVPVHRPSGGMGTEGDLDLIEHARHLELRWQRLEGMPVTVDLDGLGCLAIVGTTETRAATASAILSRLAVFTSPDDLRISLHLREETSRWEWVKWLPHARTSGAWLSVGTDDLARFLHDETVTAGHIMVIDSYQPGERWGEMVDTLLDRRGPTALTIAMVDRVEDLPTHAGATLIIEGDTATYARLIGPPVRIDGITPDRLDPPAAEVIARSLAPLTLRGTSPATPPASLTELIDVTPSQGDVLRYRAGAPPLSAPIGLGPAGAPIRLDLREAAAGGMGPHGMLIGATGSGKSELLKSLVLGLALGGAPEEVSFVFVDFKGGSTFRDLEGLPHTAGSITNLESEPRMVERMQESLTFEMTRRQRLLASAGVDRADEYRTLCRTPLEPLPALLIVVDEFGELIAGHPELMDLFTSIARTGRSVGMHLLVSGQRIDDGRLRRLDGHLRYRICLKTFTPEESVAVIGSRASFDLPTDPGHGHLLLEGETVRFRAVPVSGPPDSNPARAETPGFVTVDVGDAASDATTESARTADAETLVELLATLDAPTRKVWMNPLPERLTLAHDDRATDRLRAVFGITDRPATQEQGAAQIDFSAESGHLAVIGMPGSGKSSMLATLITSLARSHSPEDIEIHIIDHGGGDLHPLAELPHVGSVFGRAHAEGIERLLDHVVGTIEHRSTSSDDRKAMFLVVDGWSSFVREHGESLAEAVRSIAFDGSRHDVHLVISATRWSEVGGSLRSTITGRFELRLAEPLESDIDRRAAARIPRNAPGRGIDLTGNLTQVALPPADHSDIRQRWTGVAPIEPVRTLPRSIEPLDLGPGAVGVRAPDMTDWAPDLFGRHPHLLILGDGGAGKTTALRGILSSISVPVRLAVIDLRSGLRLGSANPALIGTASSARAAGILVQQILDEAANANSPPIVLAVDDHHLVSGSPDAPLERLAPLIQARAGFHLILTRRVAGLNRAAFDPMLRSLRDDGTPILLLSADPGEGRLWGTIDTATRLPGRGLLVEGRDESAVQIADFRNWSGAE